MERRHTTESGHTSGPADGARRRRRRILAVTGAAVLALVAALAVHRLTTDSSESTDSSDLSGPPDAADSAPDRGRAHSRFFSDDDPLNRKHPAAREADNSTALVKDLLATSAATLHAADAGFPVYRATSDTPTYRIAPRDHVGSWGPDPFRDTSLPWDAAWRPPDSDRAWSAVLTPGGRSVECFQMRVKDGRPSCEWGAVTDLRSSSRAITGAPTGSGISRLGGLITKDDWDAGHINHALAFGVPHNADSYVYPATGSDGKTGEKADVTWSEGQYIWLDSAYDIDGDTSLKPYERVIAHALQEYGAYDVKNSEQFAFVSQYGVRPPGSTTNYPELSDIDFAPYLHVGTVSSTPGKRGG